MYRLLIATDRDDDLMLLNTIEDWHEMHFHRPVIVKTAEKAIDVIENQSVDAVAYSMKKGEADTLIRYLDGKRGNLPLFQIRHTIDHQRQTLAEVRRVLDRMHGDFTDTDCNEQTALEMLSDEFTHRLLVGELHDEKTIRYSLQMMRSRISPEKPCVVYEFDLPQGEVYLRESWHYGSERLENALRKNFFGRYADDIYFAVAVLTPRHIRLAACQCTDGTEEPLESFSRRADKHVEKALEDIKEYLGLDLVIESSRTVEALTLLTFEDS